ncbi:MAG: aspartate--tRNA(Asn) ligase [bacterium]
MKRILIEQISEKTNQEAFIKGRVINLRSLGKSITFLVIQDYTGTIQTVWDKPVLARTGDIVELTGKVIEDKRAKSGYEIQGLEIKVISTNIEECPIDVCKPEINLQLNTLLDHRTISLRHPKVQAIFKIYDLLLEGYEKVMRQEKFTEIKTPKIIETASEGGANFFKITYFEKEAYLAQSPQLYKQMMTGVFERVFEIGSVFRAEPHFTTRHINEYIGLDAEMAMIDSFRDVSNMLNKVIKGVFDHINAYGEKWLQMYNVETLNVPEEIPHVKLSEIRKIIKERYNYEIPAETDIDPEGERLACRYAKEEFNSEFIFITNYFWKDKPFYTMPSPDNEEETEGFDLLFRGVEIATGSQRIHDYNMLIENMKKKGVKPRGLEFYLETFKFAMAPHGGWGLGSERIVQLILGLSSIKEATLFPRDVKRLNP